MPSGNGTLGAPADTAQHISGLVEVGVTSVPWLQHCAMHVNALLFCGHLPFLPAHPSADLYNVQHLDILVWL